MRRRTGDERSRRPKQASSEAPGAGEGWQQRGRNGEASGGGERRRAHEQHPEMIDDLQPVGAGTGPGPWR